MISWRRQSRIAPGTWPATATGTRVLVEHPDALVRWTYGELLRDLGYSVASCGGPNDRMGCPLVHGAGCPLVAGADVVFSTSKLPEDVIAALRDHGPRVVLEESISQPVTPSRFAAAVLEAEAA